MDTQSTLAADRHPAWLPDENGAVFAGAVCVGGTGPLVETIRGEVRRAQRSHDGTLADSTDGARVVILALGGEENPGAGERAGADGAGGASRPHPALGEALADVAQTPLSEDEFLVVRRSGGIAILGGSDAATLHGTLSVLRTPVAPNGLTRSAPAHSVRMLDHWDNMTDHPVMGTVERGYSGDSIFYHDGQVREDLSAVGEYARLLASVGINRVAINNVNVHAVEAHLLTDLLPDVARIAEQFRPWGIRVHLSVNFASPMILGGLPSADPVRADVRQWWQETTDRVYEQIPDFGGYLVKADSEGQPGPFGYDRTHADGAEPLAVALAPHGGIVHWRAFVYNHRQDWRDRSTDRARAAADHFTPLDGAFADNVVLQVKHGPMDFQVREPVSPVIGAMGLTPVAVEFQVTQEYTGHQQHISYLAPMWSEVLRFRLAGDDAPTVAESARGGLVAVSNVGTDRFWTGHPLAQANLYAFGRLAWDPEADPIALLDEWILATFPDIGDEERALLHRIMDTSLATYEDLTAPLGVGFMVKPGRHYGPDVNGYEYTPWGTYHFADRDGIGVDRSVATGTGYAGQYPPPWRQTYESVASCPDELLLFFHHVPYTHVLHSGTTVIQHIYDTHADGVDEVEDVVEAWRTLSGRIDDSVHRRVSERLVEQLRSAREWRDQIRSYFWRASGIPDERGRPLY
ncbi:MAG: alpha-glucuronidase [Mycetocola sp.]